MKFSPLAHGNLWFGWNAGRVAPSKDVHAKTNDPATKTIDPAAKLNDPEAKLNDHARSQADRIFLPRASVTLLRGYLSNREAVGDLRMALHAGLLAATSAMVAPMIFE